MDDKKNEVKIQSLCLILTNQCNFRCKYCINSDMYEYSKGYDNGNISFEVLDRALKLYVDNYRKSVRKNPNTKFVILFFGGEPLLQIDKIRYVVNKVEKEFNIKDATYGITTNGYMINRSLISYFSKHNFFINVSLDGYEDIHDLNRVTIDGKPTHKRVVRNVLETIDLLPAERYGIILTLDHQVSPKRLNQFFIDNPSLDERINRINYVLGNNTTYYTKYTEYPKYFEEVDELFEKYLRNDNITKFIEKFFESKFMRFKKRIQFSDVTCSICNPISAKLTVAVDGSLHICEKINENYSIGNVCDGIDRIKALNYYQDLMMLKKNKCTDCEVNGICNICYAQINGKGDCFEVKDDFCNAQKEDIKYWLKYYCTSLENRSRYEQEK